jgi:hypothetical protein
MKAAMKRIIYIWLGFALCLRLPAETVAEQARKIDEFTQRQLEEVLALYHAGKRSEALDQIDRGLLLTKAEFGFGSDFYQKVWLEGQVHSGKRDEAWGFDLFVRLLKAQESETHSADGSPAEADYLLYGNIIGKLRAAGRITEARELVLREQDSLAKFAKLDTIKRPYQDLGPLFSFLPDARKRDFPLMDMDEHPLPEGAPVFHYPRIYAVFEVATASRDIGDWVRAAELYQWVVDYAAAFCQHESSRAGEVCRYSLDAHIQLAMICKWHGFPAEADAIYTAFIARVSKPGYPVEAAALALAKLERLVIRSELGTLPDNAIRISEKASEIIGTYTHFNRTAGFGARISVARIYHALGNNSRAWEIIGELSALAKADINPHYRMLLLSPKIDFALEEGGKHPELENWLVRLLHFERSMGNKFNELPLYEKYATFLTLNNRLAEAVDIMEEAVRLSVVMNVPHRAEKNRQQLATLRKLIKGESRKVELQPMASRSSVIRGSTAYARFYLTNPSTVSKSGNLRMNGSIVASDRVDEKMIAVVLDATLAVKTVTTPVVIKSGAAIVIDVTGQGASEDVETEYSCAWTEDDDIVSETIWLYQSSDVATRMSVVDAHAVRLSPFHLIPIRHMIQRKGANEESESTDVKIVASEPMRIELYDKTGTTLLSVDANGDGDFQDKGDLVYQDLNGNGHPDLTMGEGESLASLYLYVEPTQIGTDESKPARDVSISILENGEWHLDAVDTIQ